MSRVIDCRVNKQQKIFRRLRGPLRRSEDEELGVPPAGHSCYRLIGTRLQK